MTPTQYQSLAQQCVNCKNLFPCEENKWAIVMGDGINCDNFVSREESEIDQTEIVPAISP